MPPFFIIFESLFALLIAVFLYFYILRAARFFLRNRKTGNVKYVKLLAGAAAVFLAAFTINLFSTYTLIILHIVVFACLLDLLHLPIRWILKKTNRKGELWNTIYRCGLVPLLVTAILIGYGAWNINRVRETQYTVHTGKGLSKQYRVVLITDLHYGNAADAQNLRKYCAEITAQDPDIVVLCGDIVDENTTATELQEAFTLLGGISNNDGIYYVFGNHDKATYRNSPNFTEMQLRDALNQNEIILLEDQGKLINGELAVVGRKDYSEQREPISALLQNFDPDNYTLVIDHQPVEYEETKTAQVELLLSGHTHAGQIWPVGLLIEPLGFADQCYGHVQDGPFHAVVSSGISAWGYPVRTEGHSEYVVIDIAAK